MATRIELQASAQQTASGNSSSFAINTITMAAIDINITDVNGTPGTIDIWAQGSDDNTNWYDIQADVVTETADNATESANNSTAPQRDIVDGYATAAALQAVGLYRHLPWRYIRIKWKLATFTDFTFSAELIGK